MILTAIFHNAGMDLASPAYLDDLIHRLASGDRDALEALYAQTRGAVYGFALSITKHSADAEDVLQETYLRAWAAAERYRSRGIPMAWLLTITKNLALMKLRERSRCQTLEQEEWELLPAAPEACAEDRQLLQAVLERLGEDERKIVMLHAVAGMKHREIAALMDLSLPAVLSKYHRALKKMRTYMEGDGADDRP